MVTSRPGAAEDPKITSERLDFAIDPTIPREIGNRMAMRGTSKTKWRRGTELPQIRDFVNLSVAAPCTHEDVIQKMAEQLRWRVEPLPDLLRRDTLPRGYTVFGSASDYLDRISLNYANMHWNESEGVLRFDVRDATADIKVLEKSEFPAEDQRQAIDAFIARVREYGRKIIRKDIWAVAGYEDRTEFERFQRGDRRSTKSGATAFNRVLNMTPEEFIRSLDKKPSRK
jgi:hypothetical protein